MATGTLKMWKAERGFGFILDDAAGTVCGLAGSENRAGPPGAWQRQDGLSVPPTLGPFLSNREHFHRQDTPRFMRA
jgi:hypothetical protein